ncbi:MAG: 50S ribosomal protein L10 [Acidobacteria bacterium]|nr:50S ribosomal protein L10 [Acidobacteriota bacterium]
MPRPEKVQAVVDIKQRLDGAQAVFVTEYAGLSVKEQQVLRRQLKASGAEMKVVKMTLARLAAAHMTDELSDLLFGPTALTFADGDPAAAAKALKAFAKDHDVLIIKGGVLGEEFLSPERVSQLADLDPREVLLAKIAGAFAAPMAQMAGLLAALPRNAATVFQQLLEKKEEESPESSVDSPQPEEESTESSVDSPQPEEESTESSVDSPQPEEESTESSVDSPQPEEETAAETEDAAAAAEDAAAETEDAAAAAEDAAPDD